MAMRAPDIEISSREPVSVRLLHSCQSMVDTAVMVEELAKEKLVNIIIPESLLNEKKSVTVDPPCEVYPPLFSAIRDCVERTKQALSATQDLLLKAEI